MKNCEPDLNKAAFWEDINIQFPNIVSAVTSLSRKSYLSITNLKTDITWWSPSAMEFFGMDENYVVRGQEKTFRSLHPEDADAFKQGFKDRIAGIHLDEPWEYRLTDGSTYMTISAKAQMLYDTEKKPFVLIIRYNNCNISEDVDPITGLHTEPALSRQIPFLLDQPGRSALLKISLDQFSHINVMYGAAFSDKILNCVAQELLHLVHGFGSVYRFSGAKFAISFTDITRDRLYDIYNDIVNALANMIEVEGKRIPIKISAGAVFLESYMEETNAVRSRLTYAQNHSRYAHHGDLVIFNDEICGTTESQFELIGLIHQCATSNFKGFRMFYQPIADTATGKICGMEALIRWELEPFGIVSPGVFMEWLEEDPCIFDLGNWILRTALEDVKKIRKYIPGCFVNVNISAAQLERREFRDAVLHILKETATTPDELCLELTERCRNLDVSFLKQEVHFFHSHGIKIALDDFGTGNSSLSLALELPFDELKVDMSFIKGIEDKPQNQAMVQSIVDYANRTDTQTCIEGIENESVRDYISQYHATFLQGYYYSKPVPIDEFEQMLVHSRGCVCTG